MQETRYDGTERLTLLENEKQLQDAVADPRNKTVTVHKPGSLMKMSDGTMYRVAPDGSWRRQ